MPLTSDPLDTLLAHNLWATRRLLESCRGLSREQFHQPFPMGPAERDGLHATLSHMISATRRWADRILARPVRPALEPLPPERGPSEPRDRTIDELMALLDESARDIAAAAHHSREVGLDSTIQVNFGGRTHTFTRGVALTHALTHNHYHRSQCRNMLRHLNVPGVSDKLPEVDVIDWQEETETH